MNNIFELIRYNSSNENYVIGDALLELFPIDYIKPSELGGASVRVCCENNAQIDYDIINTVKEVEDLISESKIVLSNKCGRNMIGSHGLMQLRTEIEHVDRVLFVPSIAQNIWDVICSHYSVPVC